MSKIQLAAYPSTFESWIVTIQPVSDLGLDKNEFLFRIRLKVPQDTPDQLYTFDIVALEIEPGQLKSLEKDKEIGENLGIETLEINVINNKTGTSIDRQSIEPIYYKDYHSTGKICIYPAKWLSGKLIVEGTLAQGFYKTLVTVTNVLPIQVQMQYALSLPAQDGLPGIVSEWQECALSGYATFQITEDMMKTLLVGTSYENTFINGTLLIKSSESSLDVEKIMTFYQVNWITQHDVLAH